MKFQINMINVEDGDAIILTLNKGDKKALVLIDGGYKNHYGKLKSRLDQLLPEYDNVINLLVCTHYDNDHLEGLECIINEYEEHIREVWIQTITETIEKDVEILQESLRLISTDPQLQGIKRIAGIEDFYLLRLTEGYNDLVRVLKKIQTSKLADKVKHPHQGDYLIGFEEFQVISPTLSYFQQKVKLIKTDQVINEVNPNNDFRRVSLFEDFNLVKETRNSINSVNPCKNLKTSSLNNGVTVPNILSIVTLFDTGQHKLLFTSDSGIETYLDQELLNDSLKHINWLQLPHHGSRNNTSEKMLSHFNPNIVFVSGDGKENRQEHLILKCLNNKRTGKNIFITNDPENTWYLSYDGYEVNRQFLE